MNYILIRIIKIFIYMIFMMFLNNKYNYNLFKIDSIIEREQVVPIVIINYRNFSAKIINCFNYAIKNFFTGKYKYSNQLFEIKFSKPFIDIPNDVFTDKFVVNIMIYSLNIYILI